MVLTYDSEKDPIPYPRWNGQWDFAGHMFGQGKGKYCESLSFVDSGRANKHPFSLSKPTNEDDDMSKEQ